MTMTTTNTSMETPDVRELSAAETADVGGGFFAEAFWRVARDLYYGCDRGGHSHSAVKEKYCGGGMPDII